MNFSSGWPSRCATWAGNRPSFAPAKSKVSPIKNLSLSSMRRASGSMRPFFTPLRKLSGRKESSYADLAASWRGKRKNFTAFAGSIFLIPREPRRSKGLLQRIHASRDGKKIPAARLFPKHYRKKMWVTRPRPEIDRVASAWLIRRFIDPQARFALREKCDGNSARIAVRFFRGRIFSSRRRLHV